MVGSQIVSLTPGLSFCHNLCCRCPNGSCEPIFNIYISIAFQWYKERHNARCFDPCNRALKFRESRRTPSSHFWECESHPHTCPEVGLRQKQSDPLETSSLSLMMKKAISYMVTKKNLGDLWFMPVWNSKNVFAIQYVYDLCSLCLTS
jgi:hypothetical protein